VELLAERGILPDKVFFLECTFAVLFARAMGRQLDPLTGQVNVT
jgi:hypothetical protein